MKLHPLTPVLIPPVWTYTAGLVFTPLVTALGSARPELSAASLQSLVFVFSMTFAGWLASRQAQPAPVTQELTTRDMMHALREGRAQERALVEQRQYATEVQTAGTYKLVIGKRTYHFPPGITPEHLIALAQVVASRKAPTDRTLVPPFRRGEGETYQVFRDWMIYHAGEKPGTLADFRTGRGDWDLTTEGKYTLLQWLYRLSPTEYAGEAKKARLALSKAIKEQ